MPASALSTRVLIMRVVLTHKLANRMDGVDVSDRTVGDVLDLEPADARALVAERWAIPDRRSDHNGDVSLERRRAGDSPADKAAAPSSKTPSMSRFWVGRRPL